MLRLGWKQLSQKVSSHVLSRTIYELNKAIFNQVADKMPLNVDMFCSGMKLPLRMSKWDGGLTVRIKVNEVFKWSKDFAQKAPEPNQFLGSVCGNDIFSFGQEAGTGALSEMRPPGVICPPQERTLSDVSCRRTPPKSA